MLSVNRNDWQLIFVVLGCNTNKERTKDSINFIEYCYNNYELVDIIKILKDEEKNVSININKGEENNIIAKVKETQYLIPILKKDIDKITVEKIFIQEVTAPINKNEKIGEIIVKINNDEICKLDLKLEKSVSKKSNMLYFKEILINMPKYFEQLF